MKKLFQIAIIFLGTAGCSHGDVHAVGYWQMGEADSGSEAGGRVSFTNDSSEAQVKLTVGGAPHYADDVATKAAEVENSRLGMRFDGNSYLAAEKPVTSQTDQIGIEAWVKYDGAMDSKNDFIVNNGRCAPGSGFGLMRQGDHFVGIFNGTTIISNPDHPIPVVAGKWIHLALVRDSQNFGTRLYVNGEVAYESKPPGPSVVKPEAVPNSNFSIAGGIGNDNLLKGSFVGELDEVRVFTFAPGTFHAGDLLYFKENK